MMRVTSERQGGWIAGFAVVGVLLAAALVGGVYYLKVRADQAVPTETQPVATPGGSSTDDKKDEKDQADTGTNSSESETKKDEDKSGETATLPSGSQTSEDDEVAAAPATLPETGPAEALVTASMVALLAFAAVTYLQSRHITL